ncbi:MAG: hypothetical protein H6810_05000 [Phycisphaeraceae bacterium]|nr:MAG: hypothetical protein H6810_05000 [Phycisphaeraceae bacterium]
MFRHHTRLIALLALAGLCPAASAQNALGDGRALDNSLNVRGRYNQARPSLAAEFAFRNAVVTGNAPGGMSFRDDVGYLAPGEFGGELGSNDLFAFRRDSLRSGMAGMGIRGTEALQYQLALTTGNRPPSNLIGEYSVNRSGTTPSAGQISTLSNPADQEGLHQRPALDPDADERGTMLWMLRSPSAYISNSSLQTSAMSQVRGVDHNLYTLTASPLRGVRLSPVPELATGEKDQGDQNAESSDGSDTPPAPQTPGQPGSAPGGDTGGGTQGAAPIKTMHSEILRRLIEEDRAASEGEDRDLLKDRPSVNDRMRRVLQALGAQPDTRRGADEDEADDRNIATDLITFDPETMQLLRGDGTPLSDYVDPSAATRDVYAEHLKAGQDLMARGRYFDAEERFAHALAIRRGDVTAQVGRLHAQIGAGLFLSAAVNLQSLATTRPEVFAAKFGESMLPDRDRLDDLVTVLGETIQDGTELSRSAGPQVRQAAGVLLAYIGYQIDRPDLVKKGLDDYRARSLAGVGPNGPLPIEAKLAAMFRAMWLPADASAPSSAVPAPADDPGPTGADEKDDG